MMLGTAVPTPSAVADVMALLRLIADPKAAKAHLDALTALGEQLTAKAAELEAREKAVTDQTAANDAALTKIAAEQKKLDDARGTNARSLEAIVDARKKLATERGEQSELVAANLARKKELDGLLAQFEQARLGMEKRAEDIVAEQQERSLALEDRETAITRGEADLKAKVAEWQRVTKALQGA